MAQLPNCKQSASFMINQPTKIAMVVDSVQVYKWQKTLIELLSQKENISIFLINLNNSTGDRLTLSVSNISSIAFI